MGKSTKAILGLLTFSQIPVFVVLAITDLDVPNWFVFGSVLVEFGLWFFYLWDIRHNSRVSPDKARVWFWTLFAFGPLAEPVYFWRFIRGYELQWPHVMDSPRQVKIAIALSWTVLVIETGDRLWRRSTNGDANTFVGVGFYWSVGTAVSTVFVALFIFATSRRHNWGRIALLLSTFGSWCLWYMWMREVAEYVWWQWLTLGSATAMELIALILVFSGRGAAWYDSASAPLHRAL